MNHKEPTFDEGVIAEPGNTKTTDHDFHEKAMANSPEVEQRQLNALQAFEIEQGESLAKRLEETAHETSIDLYERLIVTTDPSHPRQALWHERINQLRKTPR